MTSVQKPPRFTNRYIQCKLIYSVCANARMTVQCANARMTVQFDVQMQE